MKKQQGVKTVCHLLKDLTCYSPCARVLALREILENSISISKKAKCFGAKEKFEPRFEEMLLLHQNHKQVNPLLKCDASVSQKVCVSQICFRYFNAAILSARTI